jgi:hypothetical protein
VNSNSRAFTPIDVGTEFIRASRGLACLFFKSPVKDLLVHIMVLADLYFCECRF